MESSRHNVKAQRKSRGRRGLTRGELIYLTAAAVALIWQLFVPPYVGIADNGDFERVMGRFGIGHRQGTAERFFQYFVRTYDVRESLRHERPLLTSEDVFIRLAIPVNRMMFGSRIFDLRSLAFIHAAALLGLLGWLAVVSRSWIPAVRWSVRVATLLAFTDTIYVGFFSSFFAEPASILFLLTALIAAIALQRRETAFRIVVFVLAGAGFVLAKPQNVPGGIILAVLTLRLATMAASRVRWWAVAGATALLAVTVVGLNSTPRYMREWTYEVAIFWEILGHSPDPARDLQELNLDPSLVRYAGLHVWSPGAPSLYDPEFRSSFLDRMSFRRIARFYLTHPMRAWTLFDRVARQALVGRPPLGNYEQSTGAAPGAVSHKFDLFSRARDFFLPERAWSLALFFFFYAAGLLAMWLRSQNREARWICEILTGVVIMALSQFLIVAMTQGDIAAAKHLLLFRALVDVLIISIAAAAATLLWKRTQGRPWVQA